MKPFLCKVSTERPDEDGVSRPAKEQFIVYAETCTDAENTLIEKEAAADAPFYVTDVASVVFHEVFDESDAGVDKFYKVSYVLTVLDKDGHEKEKRQRALVRAASLPDALNRFAIKMANSMNVPSVTAIQETPIREIYKSQATDGTATERVYYTKNTECKTPNTDSNAPASDGSDTDTPDSQTSSSPSPTADDETPSPAHV